MAEEGRSGAGLRLRREPAGSRVGAGISARRWAGVTPRGAAAASGSDRRGPAGDRQAPDGHGQWGPRLPTPARLPVRQEIWTVGNTDHGRERSGRSGREIEVLEAELGVSRDPTSTVGEICPELRPGIGPAATALRSGTSSWALMPPAAPHRLAAVPAPAW